MNFFITNREIINGESGQEYVREDGFENAGDNLRFGVYQEDEFKLFPEPTKDIDLIYSGSGSKDINELTGSLRFFRSLYDVLIADSTDGGDVLFFIHGFNTNLKKVRENFKMLNTKYVDNTNSPIEHIVIFTWPGRTHTLPLHYRDDKFDAERSGVSLARGFEKVIQFFNKFLLEERNKPCKKKIHLMVHSMGHRVLKHMLREMIKQNISFPEIFSEILLIAADIEYDIFKEDCEYDYLIELGKRIHIYYHEDDHVLKISQYSKTFSRRLGRSGRKRVDTTIKDVYDIDVSNTIDDKEFDFIEENLNHWYYYSSKEVVNSIIEVLKSS